MNGKNELAEPNTATSSRMHHEGRNVEALPPTKWLMLRRNHILAFLIVFVVLTGLWDFSTSERLGLMLLIQPEMQPQTKAMSTANEASSPKTSSATYTVPTTAHKKPLPIWMQDYVKFYHSQLNVSAAGEITLKPNAKYLQWSCRRSRGCGGIGDRLNGIVQGLYMAICTDRVLLVDWASPTPLTALQPALLPWNVRQNVAPASIIRTVDNHKSPYLLDPTQLPIDQGLVLWNNLWRDTKGSFVRNTTCLEKYWSEHGGLDATTQIYQTAFWTLFQWSPIIVQHTENLKRRAGLSQTPSLRTRPYIGVHVRTGKGASWDDPVRHSGESDLRQFYQCARVLQQGIHEICPPLGSGKKSLQLLNVYVASDNLQAKETLQQWDMEDLRRRNDTNPVTRAFHFASNLEVMHIDRSTPDRMQDPAAAELDAWAELSTLIDAVCLVTSRSQFSNIPMWVSTHQPRCSVRFDHCSAEDVAIALQVLKDNGCPSYE